MVSDSWPITGGHHGRFALLEKRKGNDIHCGRVGGTASYAIFACLCDDVIGLAFTRKHCHVAKCLSLGIAVSILKERGDPVSPAAVFVVTSQSVTAYRKHRHNKTNLAANVVTISTEEFVNNS